MEETLGKRIAAGRKRLGLTQDQLAERLGVTAQAVSKWENDQSCPDITMLPKLAEIFGITTDQLLGREPKETVYKGEVVAKNMDDEEAREKDGLHFQKGQWEFQWDSGKKSSVGMAVWVLLVGGLLLASNLLDWNAGMWDILWPSGLLVFGLFGLFPKFSFFRLGCGFFGAYFLLCNLNVKPFDLGKELLLPIFLVLFGLSLLADALRKPEGHRFHVSRSGKDISKHKSECSMEGECFNCSASFGEDTQVIYLPRLSGGEADVSFGQLTVDLRGCEEIAPSCRIEANCSFGELVFLVPRQYRVEAATSTAFASVDFRGSCDCDPKAVIAMDANASFGEISIRYI